MIKKIFAVLLCVIVFTSVGYAEEVGDISNTDRLVKRIQTKDFWVIGLGPAWLVNFNDTKTGISVPFGRIWEASENGEIRLLGELITTGDSYFGKVILGGSYLPATTTVSLVAGGGLGVGIAEGDSDAEVDLSVESGFVAEAWFGVRLFRLASTQLEIMANYSLMFAENEEGRPGAASLRVNLLY